MADHMDMRHHIRSNECRRVMTDVACPYKTLLAELLKKVWDVNGACLQTAADEAMCSKPDESCIRAGHDWIEQAGCASLHVRQVFSCL